MSAKFVHQNSCLKAGDKLECITSKLSKGKKKENKEKSIKSIEACKGKGENQEKKKKRPNIQQILNEHLL